MNEETRKLYDAIEKVNHILCEINDDKLSARVRNRYRTIMWKLIELAEAIEEER